MNRDIRMLILYKQHYMDQYKRPLTECQYSCWGYYDGMSIIEVNRIESRLFEKKISFSNIRTMVSCSGKCKEFKRRIWGTEYRAVPLRFAGNGQCM